MDDVVVRAMQRWPDVPAVSGYLSLDLSGRWRYHADGDALLHPDQAGEPILHAGLTAFLSRNYQADTQGRWYIQNGPQQVFVRLDGAPLILHLASDGRLCDHTGQKVSDVLHWYVSAQGMLYLRTPRGPALLAGRDLPLLAEQLRQDNGHGLETLDLALPHYSSSWSTPAYPAARPLTVWSLAVSPERELAYIALPETDPI
ncbi:DUF2946 family protein [Alcaligenes sp. SDU_A2]|uniref:DUF2946 family protein n=1 Tax=Alcaligenes sp. SDU_A2 TaxID=3136634 RepID=UPI00311E225B